MFGCGLVWPSLADAAKALLQVPLRVGIRACVDRCAPRSFITGISFLLSSTEAPAFADWACAIAAMATSVMAITNNAIVMVINDLITR